MIINMKDYFLIKGKNMNYIKFETIIGTINFVKCETYYFDKVLNKIMPHKHYTFLNVNFIESVCEGEDGVYSVQISSERFSCRFIA